MSFSDAVKVWERIKGKKVRSVMIINTESVSISPWPLIFQLGFFFFRSFYPSIQLIPSGLWLSSHRKGSSDPPVLFFSFSISPFPSITYPLFTTVRANTHGKHTVTEAPHHYFPCEKLPSVIKSIFNIQCGYCLARWMRLSSFSWMA